MKILQHVQEEVVEQSVVCRCDKEGLGGIIFRLDAVCRVVLLEVEQAACITDTNETARSVIGISEKKGKQYHFMPRITDKQSVKVFGLWYFG